MPVPLALQWVQASHGYIPPNAVVGGYENGVSLYIARAKHSGAVLPGKLQPAYKMCYVPDEGKEHEYGEYEVLCATAEGERNNWQKVSGNEIPQNAVQGGHTKEGEPLYIGRHRHAGGMHPGKVQKSSSCLYIPYGGTEYSYHDYEILLH